MKNLLLIISFLFFTQFFFAQKKVCTTQEENSIDLNTISLNKCAIESEKPEPRKRIQKNIIARNRIIKRKQVQESKTVLKASSEISITTSNSFEIENPVKFQNNEILFSLVDEVPLFPNCDNNLENTKKCFKDNLQKHFLKYYYPEIFSEEGVQGRILIQFTIDIYGKPKDIQVISSKPNNNITKEVNRIINKLPTLTTGKHKGLPINVKYAFPINLTLN